MPVSRVSTLLMVIWQVAITAVEGQPSTSLLYTAVMQVESTVF